MESDFRIIVFIEKIENYFITLVLVGTYYTFYTFNKSKFK